MKVQFAVVRIRYCNGVVESIDIPVMYETDDPIEARARDSARCMARAYVARNMEVPRDVQNRTDLMITEVMKVGSMSLSGVQLRSDVHTRPTTRLTAVKA